MKEVLKLIAMGLMVAGGLMTRSPLANALRYLGLAYLMLEMARTARDGYLKRRPYWTRESWRRFLLACTIPVCAILIVFAMAVAIDLKFPMAGIAGSPARQVWALGLVIFLLMGAVGLSLALYSFADGDASSQYTWSPRRWWRFSGQ